MDFERYFLILEKYEWWKEHNRVKKNKEDVAKLGTYSYSFIIEDKISIFDHCWYIYQEDIFKGLSEVIDGVSLYWIR